MAWGGSRGQKLCEGEDYCCYLCCYLRIIYSSQEWAMEFVTAAMAQTSGSGLDSAP